MIRMCNGADFGWCVLRYVACRCFEGSASGERSLMCGGGGGGNCIGISTVDHGYGKRFKIFYAHLKTVLQRVDLPDPGSPTKITN